MAQIIRVVLLALLLAQPSLAAEISLGVFQVDVTPPVGSPLCDALVPSVEKVDDPLSARGVIVIGAGRPIVLCAVDWVGIGNTGHDLWREAIAKAAGTTVDRVAVHCLHQHDAPGFDLLAEELAAMHALAGKLYNIVYSRQVIGRMAEAVRDAAKKTEPVTHIGVGRGKVLEVASNRRIVQADGKVGAMRGSSCKDEALRAAPEGVIDPWVKLVAFFHGDRPIAALTYYATHPQSYYGRGAVSADFPGLARTFREKSVPHLPLIHFNGAGGNVAAGKYNDGSEPVRAILAERLAKGMALAWEDARSHRQQIEADKIVWRTSDIQLPARESLHEDKLIALIDDPTQPERMRLQYCRDLAFLKRCQAGHKTTLSAFELGPATLLHLPGELFIEYQLSAQELRTDSTVCVAAYGDYGAGYIGTSIAYDQGGYETSRVSRVSPTVEPLLKRAISQLLKPAK